MWGDVCWVEIRINVMLFGWVWEVMDCSKLVSNKGLEFCVIVVDIL